MGHQQDAILKRIKELVELFDADLQCLRHDRQQVAIVTKMAEIRQVVLFLELLLLREFEKRENSLLQKLEAKQAEKADMTVKVSC